MHINNNVQHELNKDTHIEEKGIILNSNEIILYNLPSSSNVDTKIFARLLEDSRVVASYKMYWLLGILEEVNLGNIEITFKRLVARMLTAAWYPTLQYKLYFGQFDNLVKSINYISSIYCVPTNINNNELLEFICSLDDNILNKQMKDLTNNVPYMLLTPFFDDKIKGTSSSKRVRKIIELSLSESGVLYKIIKDSNNIVMDEDWAIYMKSNYKVIKSWIYYKLSCFLQKRNPNVPAIIFKLDPPISRSLSKSTRIWTSIIADRNVKDIYTGREFSRENYDEPGVLSIDHFIPWSFVMHDEMWNLVPTFKNINSSKSDKLLRYENYIDDFCDIQYEAFSFMCDNNRKKDLEPYVDILRLENPLDFYKYKGKEGFSEKLKTSIAPIYQIAVNQGFSVIYKL
ncbi:MAG: HNH endonuclease domain-containing protein [Clostridium sp.]|uniref:HNH endonuclease domain-containing protein n=1 Tax=Clostridium TaxID=1485 RepID=UPI0028FFA6B5|nr:HNH endonuclease domain-containing protein [Clostridium sp.]MDU1278612.1 HNH endonuclease domain-containing protein [Clostridium sp.]MDU7088419.1 HNH endonuclease domain-containing protein [Clostridium sp.]MDU7948934.1 HNH endonuclease domain-containing protein [Clostridium sp.]